MFLYYYLIFKIFPLNVILQVMFADKMYHLFIQKSQKFILKQKQ